MIISLLLPCSIYSYIISYNHDNQHVRTECGIRSWQTDYRIFYIDLPSLKLTLHTTIMLSHFSTCWNLLVGFWVVCKNLSNQVIIVKFVYREEESQSEEAYLLNGLFVICKGNSKSLRLYCSRPIINMNNVEVILSFHYEDVAFTVNYL